MKRVVRSLHRKLGIFQDHLGICHICGARIDGVREPWHLDHIIPLALGGEDTEANLAPVHAKCHATKTKGDVKTIAKAKRVHAKHHGAREAKSPLPGGRRSRWKRKITGEVVER